MIYGSSVLLLAVAEAVTARYVPGSWFGAYQLVRLGSPIVAAVVLIGVDQSTPRVFAPLDAVLPRFRYFAAGAGLASVILGAAIGFSISTFLSGAATVAIGLALVPPGIVASALASSQLRARGKYTVGAVAQQGHRAILGVGLLVVGILGLWGGASILVGAAVVAAATGAVIAVRLAADLDRLPRQVTPLELRQLAVLGLPIAVSAMSLGAMDWFDQIALAMRFEGLEASGEYAATKLYVVYPFIAAASVLGFALLPEFARRGRTATAAVVGRLGPLLLVIAGGLAVLWTAILRGFDVILPFEADGISILLLALAGSARFALVIPGAAIGAYGGATILRWFALASILIVCLEVAFIVGGPIDEPLLAGSTAVLIATLCRLVLAAAFARHALSAPHADGSMA